jgi:hypothetical protein
VRRSGIRPNPAIVGHLRQIAIKKSATFQNDSHVPSAVLPSRRLTATGLVLDFVHEHPWLRWPPFPMCIPNGNGAYRLPKGATPLPLAVLLRAVNSRIART